MIEFRGELSKECSAETEKRKKKTIAIAAAVTMTFSSVIVLVYWIFWSTEIWDVLIWLIMLAVVFIILLIISDRAITTILPKRIIIENGYISQEVEGLSKGFQPKKRPISKVKK